MCTQIKIPNLNPPSLCWSFVTSVKGRHSGKEVYLGAVLKVGGLLSIRVGFQSKIDGTAPRFSLFLTPQGTHAKSSVLKCLEHTNVFSETCGGKCMLSHHI